MHCGSFPTQVHLTLHANQAGLELRGMKFGPALHAFERGALDFPASHHLQPCLLISQFGVLERFMSSDFVVLPMEPALSTVLPLTPLNANLG